MRIVHRGKLTESVPGFAEVVTQASGQEVEACYQCGKCTAGCPLAPAMDMKPNQVIRACQLGFKDMVLESNAIWHCSGCETCGSRCPRDINMSRVNKALARLCVVEGRQPKDHAVMVFHKSFMESMGRWGRAHEMEIMSLTKLRDSSQRLKDIGLGAALFTRGRLALLPQWVRRGAKVRQIFADDAKAAAASLEKEPTEPGGHGH
ncbi:MAG: 4Fe-4S dicluster domain-containing protein [Armatimonadota bacterium]